MRDTDKMTFPAVKLTGMLDDWCKSSKLSNGWTKYSVRFLGNQNLYVSFIGVDPFDITAWNKGDKVEMVVVYETWQYDGRQYSEYVYVGGFSVIPADARDRMRQPVAKVEPAGGIYDLCWDRIRDNVMVAHKYILAVAQAIDFYIKNHGEPPEDELPVGIIYEAHNKVTGRHYIGQTTWMSPEFRYPDGFLGDPAHKVNPKIQADRKQHGSQSFVEPVIIDVVYGTKDDLDRAEAHYIHVYDSVAHGYNRNSGNVTYNELSEMEGVSVSDIRRSVGKKSSGKSSGKSNKTKGKWWEQPAIKKVLTEKNK